DTAEETAQDAEQAADEAQEGAGQAVEDADEAIDQAGENIQEGADQVENEDSNTSDEEQQESNAEEGEFPPLPFLNGDSQSPGSGPAAQHAQADAQEDDPKLSENERLQRSVDRLSDQVSEIERLVGLLEEARAARQNATPAQADSPQGQSSSGG